MKTLASPRDKDEILRRLKAVRPDSARRWGRMSAPQMVCHLCDAFRMALDQKPVRPVSSLAGRTVMKWVALYLPLPWPAGIPTRPEIDQECGGTPPADFAADVAQVEAFVELVSADPQRCHGQRHPLFGPMSVSAWLRWGYLHTDHHLRQFGA